MIKNINIKATALEEFWGDEFNDSIYLWEGSKHNYTLNEIDKLLSPTFSDIFYSAKQKEAAFRDCQNIYYRQLPIITKKLNAIHHLNLPESFWKIVFGYWFYRHICIVYEKYAYLSKLDLKKTSIKLLDKESFFIPNDHYEYLSCFSNDFGVQQLVSHYYYLFATKNYPIEKHTYKINTENQSQNNPVYRKYLNTKAIFLFLFSLAKKVFDKIVTALKYPHIALLGAHYTRYVRIQLLLKSWGRIQEIKLPHVEHDEKNTNYLKRKKIIDISSDNDFEKYLINTYYYCFPKMFIEKFHDYYDTYIIDIQRRNLTHIVSENWISNIPTAIYCATAKNLGKHIIASEHATGGPLQKYASIWMDITSSDTFLNTGWDSTKFKIATGGFSARKIKSYTFGNNKEEILLISHTLPFYHFEFSSHPSTSKFIDKIRNIHKIIECLPPDLSNRLVYRPRKTQSKSYWNTEFQLDILKKRGIKIDYSEFSKSILNSKIVVIDHFSTGLAEILLMGAPFLLISNSIDLIENKYKSIFVRLEKCGVMHDSSESAVLQLENIYNDIEKWWKSKSIQKTVNDLKSSYLGPSSNTVNYLLSCLNK